MNSDESQATRDWLAKNKLSISDKLIVSNWNFTVQLKGLCNSFPHFNEGRWVVSPLYINGRYQPPFLYNPDQSSSLINFFGYPIDRKNNIKFCKDTQNKAWIFKRFFIKYIVDNQRSVTAFLIQSFGRREAWILYDPDVRDETGINRNYIESSDQPSTTLVVDMQRDSVADDSSSIFSINFSNIPMKRL